MMMMMKMIIVLRLLTQLRVSAVLLVLFVDFGDMNPAQAADVCS